MVSLLGQQSSVPANVPPQLLANLPVLHEILESIVQEWLAAVAPFQTRLTEAADPALVTAEAMYRLQVPFLKCVFSYALFFMATDEAYKTLWSKLTAANTSHLKGHKRPKTRAQFQTIKAIRDLSIAHMGDPKGGRDELDVFALMTWTPFTLEAPIGGTYDLTRLTFRDGTFTATGAEGKLMKSGNFRVQIPALHAECLGYLQEWDDACVAYITDLQAAHL